MIHYATILFYLLAGHALADYPLQGDFVAQAKNRHTPVGKDIWWMVLPSHAIIHGGFVCLITGSLILGILEFVAHTAIDYTKCEGKLTYAQDQLAHVLCKVIWLLFLILFNH